MKLQSIGFAVVIDGVWFDDVCYPTIDEASSLCDHARAEGFDAEVVEVLDLDD